MTEQTRNVVLTIFTPTYNRAHLLPRLFESIASQAKPGDSVEWLIIDDGSTDETPSVLARFVALRPDLVRFLRVRNGGKHRAINHAASAANGEWMMIVDSDDLLTAGAITKLLNLIVSESVGARVGAIRAPNDFIDPDFEVKKFRLKRNPASYSEWRRGQSHFETVDVFRLCALRSNEFPDVPGERFMSEAWLRHAVDRRWLTYFSDHALLLCEYQRGGLSEQSNRLRAENPVSAMLVYEAIFSSAVGFWLKVRSSINWWRYWFHAGRPNTGARSWIACCCLGLMLYVTDVVRGVGRPRYPTI